MIYIPLHEKISNSGASKYIGYFREPSCPDKHSKHP